MTFTTTTRVRMGHVDPAGMVFYPRYFEMINNAVEDWFEQALGMDLATMHMVHHFGVPTVKLDVTFLEPSRVGEDLTISIVPLAVGRSSCNVRLVFSGAGEDRLVADMVIVCMAVAEKKAMPWPEDLRRNLAAGLASG